MANIIQIIVAKKIIQISPLENFIIVLPNAIRCNAHVYEQDQ